MNTKYVLTKLYIPFMILIMLFVLACNNEPETEKTTVIMEEPKVESNELKYDSVLAAEYGADAYGMKPYVMALLKKGPNREIDSAKAADLQMAHMKNIQRMAEEKKLLLAGPFMDDGEVRGIYIFDVATIEEAEALTNSDPAVQAGSLIMELKPWYGSAALMGLSDVHATLQKSGITD